eukprot:TRINITY_DN617_c0_g1_i2.p1 TRINITY_DN617_c0_g1~~TRINITY_DN617_c0_g1_i2.p1  ORF type:complete len:266 (-),score=52.79 TRINITY_DN617_c0_g1_i2:404-1201(-)
MEVEPFAPSAFGSSLISMMIAQKNEGSEASSLIIPEPLYVIASAINELGGHRQEGIFRIPGTFFSPHILGMGPNTGVRGRERKGWGKEESQTRRLTTSSFPPFSFLLFFPSPPLVVPFLLPGETAVVNRLRTELQHRNYRCDFVNCNNAATLFKLFLRELEHPLIPYEHYFTILRMGQEKSEEGLKEALKTIPLCHQDTLWWVVEYVRTFLVDKTIEVTKMDRRNFSLVFGSTLFRCPPSDDPLLVMNAAAAHTEATYFLLGLSR